MYQKKDFHNQDDVWVKYVTALDESNKRRIEKTISLMPEDTNSVLEVGCGSGAIINNLSSYDFVVGLDLSPTALKYVTRKKALGSCDSLPFRDNFFDIVIAAELLEHLDIQTLKKTVMEIKRVAGKYILISVPYKERPWETFVKCASCNYTYSPYNHQQYFNIERLRHLLESEELRVYFSGTKKRLPKIRRIMQILGFYSYRENVICPLCGSKKLRYGKIEKKMGYILGFLNERLAKSEPNWILCLYRLKK